MENEKSVSKLGKGLIVFCVLFGIFTIVFLNLRQHIIKEEVNNNDKNNEKVAKEQDNQTLPYYDYKMCVESEVFENDGYIYDIDKVVYECKNKDNCGFIRDYIFDYCNYSDKLALIYDGDKKMLYDYKNMKEVLEADDFFSTIYQSGETLDYAYLLFKKDGKVGIMSIKGTVLVDAIYDDIALADSEYDGEYNIKRDVVIATKDGKTGVIKMENGEIVVPFDYEYIKIYDNHYVLRNNDIETLVDLDLKPILEDYKRIDIFYDLAFVEKDNKITIYDLNGVQFASEEFDIKKSFENNDTSGYYVISMHETNEVLTISVRDNNENIACYDFDIKNKKFTTLDCKELFDDLED